MHSHDVGTRSKTKLVISFITTAIESIKDPLSLDPGHPSPYVTIQKQIPSQK